MSRHAMLPAITPYGRRRMGGLSLIELMVAVALGLLILAGLITVFVNTSAARNEVERTSRQIENGRYAIELLSDDIRLAGYYGGLNPASAIPAIGVPAALSDPCSVTVADWGPSLYLHVQGYNASNGGLGCMPASYKAGTDVLVLRRVRTCTAGSAGCALVSGGPYIQVSRCATETPVTTHKLGLEGTETFDLTLKNCATVAALQQYYVNIYFISTDNGAGQNVPTLKRLDFTGVGAPTETPLIEGIEQINIEYGIDYMDSGGLPVPDGLPDAYSADPAGFSDAAGCPACVFNAVNNWMNVVTVRYFVLARNLETSPGHTDTKTYNLGATAFGPFNDGYRRHVYSSLVRIMNPAARRDLP